MLMESLRVAFLGTGRISDLHALAYLDDKRADIVAVCDRSIDLAQARGRRWGLAESGIFSDYHEMLAAPDIDLVEILLPHHLHHQEADGAHRRAGGRDGRRGQGR